MIKLFDKNIDMKFIIDGIYENEICKAELEVKEASEYILFTPKTNSKIQKIGKVHFKISGLNVETFYAPRFDWSLDKVYFNKNTNESLACQQWFSPPPFCYMAKEQGEWFSIGLVSPKGENNFICFDYTYNNGEYDFSLDYEGHLDIDGNFSFPSLEMGKCLFSKENDALKNYVDILEKENVLKIKDKEIYSWWKKPIFCGWGNQRYNYRQDNENSEHGDFVNVKMYSNEPIYREYVDVLEKERIPFGTLIIDMLWSEKEALAKPYRRLWIDLKKFISELHNKGKKVILWYAPFLFNGLQKTACCTLNDRAVCADPTNPIFKNIQFEEINKMLGKDGLDADGFKIDFTQEIPSERQEYTQYLENNYSLSKAFSLSDDKYTYPSLNTEHRSLIKTYSGAWGVELIYAMIENIYTSMKQVKKDSMLITHTANPYFANIVDVLRLNDMDGTSTDVLKFMRNRAEIASACNPKWLIDTDNDLMVDKKHWRDYMTMQSKLGIPDTYYITGIAQSMESFNSDDYELLRNVFNDYIKDNNL